MSQILRDPRAFQRPRQRRPRVEDGSHLAFIRRLPCLSCGLPGPSEAAHLSASAPAIGKRERGKSEKADDKWTLPLCRVCHTEQHSQNEIKFWKALNIDPFKTALALWAATGDDETGAMIVHNAGAE